MERDTEDTSKKRRTVISTHTLTWSVTERRVKIIENKVISTHTLTWSVTFFGTIHPGYERISTHTLTWSVTPRLRPALSAWWISTHTLTWSVTTLTFLLKCVL